MRQWKKVWILKKIGIDWVISIFPEPVKRTRQQDLDARLAQLQAKKGNIKLTSIINVLMFIHHPIYSLLSSCYRAVKTSNVRAVSGPSGASEAKQPTVDPDRGREGLG